MTENVLQTRGIVAVCFSCGVEKKQVFASCENCGEQPRQDDELLDSLLLSRYTSSELLLSRAIAERSPGTVIKAANRASMRAVSKALQDPQLRQLLGLSALKSDLAQVQKSDSEQLVESMTQTAKKELVGQLAPSLNHAQEPQTQLSVWVQNERTLQALHSEGATATSEQLLEAINALAERCRAVEQRDLQSYLNMLTLGDDIGSDERRLIWRNYQQSLVDRVVVSLERVKTSVLIDLFVRLEVATEQRRDKQALPITKALLAVYKTNALETLRIESDNAQRLMSAIRTNSAEDQDISQNMIDALQDLLINWRHVASPLAGVIADREVSSIRREIQSELQDVADHLADEMHAVDLSAQASRMALELM